MNVVLPKQTTENKTRKLWEVPKKYLPEFLLCLGLFLMSISGTHWYFKFQSLSLDKELLAQYEQYQQSLVGQTTEDSGDQATQRPPKPTHISIQWFIDVSISTQILVNDRWTIAEKEASYLAQSARPGEKGNIIIYGHNTREIMGNIRALKGTETITLTLEDGSKREYKITKIAEVKPDQTEFLEPTEEETLTLYTCSGFMDKMRFIVQAKPVE